MPNLRQMTEIFGGLESAVGALELLLRAIFFLIGIYLVLRALLQAARRSDLGAQAGSWAGPIICFATGVALLAFPATLAVLVASVFGAPTIASPQSIFSHDRGLLDSFEGSQATSLISLIVAFIQLIGFIAVGRGLLMLNRATTPGGPPLIGPGITFLVAGVLAANFPIFFGALAAIFVT